MADTPETLLARYAAALRQQDPDAAAACFTPDAVVMAQGAPTASGGGVRGLYAQIVGSLRLDIAFTIADTVAGSDGRIAVFTHSRGTQIDVASGKDSPESNREAFVLVPADGGLRISRYLFNVDA